MTNQDNGATHAPADAARARLRDLILLRLQAEHLQSSLAASQAAADNLVQRQLVGIPLTNDPDFTLHLIQDILAVSNTLAGLSVPARELLATIERIAPPFSSPTST